MKDLSVINHQRGAINFRILMPRYQYGCLLLVLVHSLSAAPGKTSEHQASTGSWTGVYLGAKAGAGFSKFKSRTTHQTNQYVTPDQANTIINNPANQTINTRDFFAGIEGGLNRRVTDQFLLGLQFDAQSLGSNGMALNIIPRNDAQHVISSYANNNWLFSVRPRLGWLIDRLLVYATGGLSVALIQSDFIFSSSKVRFESQRVNTLKPGYAVGGGIETALTQSLSFKAEYLFEHLGNSTASPMSQIFISRLVLPNVIKMEANLISFGLNYYFDAHLPNPLLRSNLFDWSHWNTEVGTLLFFSSGTDGAPQPLYYDNSKGPILVSRLIFSDLSALSGEVFARAEHDNGFFVKGYLGAGIINKGRLNDEDFPAAFAYSNTLSKALGNLSYATVDVGYTILKTLSGKMGPFIGYNYYAQNINSYGCSQVAGDVICVPSTLFNNFLIISQDDHYNSFRLGLSTEFDLIKKWSLRSEVAYLPFVQFDGLDMHNGRQLKLLEKASKGDGAMLEAGLNYPLNNDFDLGLGGRYWMWNMRNGRTWFDFLDGTAPSPESSDFNSNRYGVFFQIKYHTAKTNPTEQNTTPNRWRGLFIGGHLGGSWGSSYWSDPFSATQIAPGFYNLPGFGNKIDSTGPMAGGKLHATWQTGHLVYGVSGSLSRVDIRGENTLFSSLVGVNGQETVHYIATVVGRLGTSVHDVLFYVNAGKAALNIKYQLNGNNNGVELGTGSQSLTAWGLSGGIGAEYAFNQNWSSSVEYDAIRIPTQSLLFPTIQLVNAQPISNHQNLNVFQLGIHYKLI
jgi:opacity protein-like surface antigen